MDNMKQFQLPDGREGLAFTVPTSASNIKLVTVNSQSAIQFDNGFGITIRTIPEGHWQILADTSTMSEEVAHLIVPHDIETEYPEYGAPYDIIIYYGGHDTAIDAFNEWFQSEIGLDPENRYIILTKG